jgi:hypothetical protein
MFSIVFLFSITGQLCWCIHSCSRQFTMVTKGDKWSAKAKDRAEAPAGTRNTGRRRTQNNTYAT